MLKGIGAASVSTLVGGALPVTVSADVGDTTVLGDFESDFDGWRTNDESELDRVEIAERPVAVTSGTYGLEVTTNTAGCNSTKSVATPMWRRSSNSYSRQYNDDLSPTIENETRVQDADFVEYPYLFATVTPEQVFGTDSAVTVRFRLHYRSDGLLDDDTSVTESAPTTVRPHVASVLTWDTSGIDETKRSNATRLEIVWYPDADLSTADLLGDDSGNGWTVVFDDVRLSDDRDRTELVQMADHWERLKFANGAYRDTKVLSRTDLLESGEFVFGDGTAVPYTIERLPGGEIRYVIDGITYRLGDGFS